jgi:hypothetical protein
MRSRSSHGDDTAEAHAARASTEAVQRLYVQKRYVQKLNSTLRPGTKKTENQKIKINPKNCFAKREEGAGEDSFDFLEGLAKWQFVRVAIGYVNLGFFVIYKGLHSRKVRQMTICGNGNFLGPKVVVCQLKGILAGIIPWTLLPLPTCIFVFATSAETLFIWFLQTQVGQMTQNYLHTPIFLCMSLIGSTQNYLQ